MVKFSGFSGSGVRQSFSWGGGVSKGVVSGLSGFGLGCRNLGGSDTTTYVQKG